MMKILPKLLLFLCAVALLLGLVLYAIGMKHTTNRTEITFMVKADSTGMVTPETRAMARFYCWRFNKRRAAFG